MEQPTSTEHQPGTRYDVVHTETGEEFDINTPRFERVENALTPGLYRHHKSAPGAERYYSVEMVVRDLETDEAYVIYCAEYETEDDGVYARPLSNFLEPVAKGAGMVPRFHFIGREF